MQVVGSDTLKPYTDLLPSRTGIYVSPRGLNPAGNKASVSLLGADPSRPARIRPLLSPSERAPGPMSASPSQKACAQSHAA